MGTAPQSSPSEPLLRLRRVAQQDGPHVRLAGALLPVRWTDTVSVVRLPDDVEVHVVRPAGGYASLLWEGALLPEHLHGCSVFRAGGLARYVHVYYRQSVVAVGQFGDEFRVRADELAEQAELLETIVRKLRVLMRESYRHESSALLEGYSTETLARVGHARVEAGHVVFRGGQSVCVSDADELDWNED